MHVYLFCNVPINHPKILKTYPKLEKGGGECCNKSKRELSDGQVFIYTLSSYIIKYLR